MLLVAVGLLSSCGFSKSQKGEGEVEYFPFKERKDGNWGLMGTDGTPLFRDEFKHAITIVKDGRFFARNADFHWELYTAEPAPKQIGETYVSVGAFHDGVAPVVRKGKPIEFIDTEGEVVFTFDKVNDKVVEVMGNFNNGVATFGTSDSHVGIVDTKGKVILEPRYLLAKVAGDRLIAIEGVTPEESYVASQQDSLVFEKGTVTVFTLDGEKRWSFEASKCEDMVSFAKVVTRNVFHEDKIVFYAGKGDERKAGIINDKGEWVVKPTSNTKDIYDFKGDKLIYSNGETVGLMDFEGNVLIRAKYKSLSFSRIDGVLIAEKKDGLKTEAFLVDEEGNTISKDEYTGISDFSKDGLAVAQTGESSYVMIDAKGEEHKNGVDVYEWSNLHGSDLIESEDLSIFVEELNITRDGFLDLSLMQTPEEVLNVCLSAGSVYPWDASQHTSTTLLYYSIKKSGVDVGGSAEYAAPIGIYDGTQYVFHKNFPKYIAMAIMKSAKFEGQSRDLMKAVVAKYEKLGFTMKHEGDKVTGVSKEDDRSVSVEIIGESIAIILKPI